MKIRILGCGTSTGVPKIGNQWGQCDPDEPRNRRTRSSIILDSAGETLLVDCGPDLRQQLLAGDIGRIDGLIVTHDHADHVHGIDDLRPLAQVLQRPCADARRTTSSGSRNASLTLLQAGIYPPVVQGVALEKELRWGASLLRFAISRRRHHLARHAYEEGVRSAVIRRFLNDAGQGQSLSKHAWDLRLHDAPPHPTHAHLDALLNGPAT